MFAPTDTAFTNLFTVLSTTPHALLANTALVTAVMHYHIVPEEVFYQSDTQSVTVAGLWISNDEFLTLLGQRVTVAVPPAPRSVRLYYGQPTLNADTISYTSRATVVTPDIKATRAVIPTISRMLLPALAP